jgi:hypothetical protein
MLPAASAAFDTARAGRSLFCRRAAYFDRFIGHLTNRDRAIRRVRQIGIGYGPVCDRIRISVRRLPGRLCKCRRLRGGRGSQISADAEQSDDRHDAGKCGRQPILNEEIRLANVAKPSAVRKVPIYAINLFAAIAAKLGFKIH